MVEKIWSNKLVFLDMALHQRSLSIATLAPAGSSEDKEKKKL